ncbi:hypothetical protein PMI07_000859 [Rhizobium sp. CF080]|uniref:hypothetical protein n=1 Tax=Rhizobium sp. (strain CF080) TaxID=1144310 RepID=UPI000271CD1D|nr:hypothetical protein [Rhizobium sp. CF080]EUB97283.1 hypothetical protein PMI07_000859 [Rhizobium sp. CF080]
MNADSIRPVFRYVGRLTTPDLEGQGIVYRFDCGKPRRQYHLVFQTDSRRFRAGVKIHNGFGTTKRLPRPRKLAELFLSMIPPEERARCLAASLAA